MCGIAGYFGPTPPDSKRVAACLALMNRRGPDGDGSLIRGGGDRSAVLLHSRLAIIDLAPRSDQPFSLGGKHLVFNGELYNYRELKEALAREGRTFRTDSDTEVLLTALDAWGWEALDRFEGMWAFALYDEADGSLTLCRDRFGQKPLHVLREAGGIVFGSEPKFLAALRGGGLPVNRRHLRRYLVNGYKSLYKTDETFFTGLREVRPAQLLRIAGDGSVTEHVYWTPAYRPDDGMDFADAVHETRRRMIETVRLHLRSDVPIAFCMSGGVDSNALIAIAKRVFDYDVHGFTVVLDDERYDEAEAVARCVADLGIRHSAITVSPEGGLAAMDTLIAHRDAPVYTITYVLHWLLMKEIHRHGYKISTSGSGADELFSGYYDHYLMHLRAVHGTPEHAAALAAWRRHVQPAVRNPFLRDPDLFVRNPDFRDHIYLGSAAFAATLREPFDEPFTETSYAPSLLRNRMMNELFHEGIPVILHEDDLNAMHHSIENRSPYLSRDLFDFCYTIPDRLLIRDGYNKAVLREAMRGIVPDTILDSRLKVGFNGPVRALIDTADPAVRQALLADSPIFDIVRREAIARLLDKAELPNSESKFLFYFVNAKLFLERFDR